MAKQAKQKIAGFEIIDKMTDLSYGDILGVPWTW